MIKPKVSVIIPAYNCEKYIGRCLESVLKQSFGDFEILVVNDGSCDETGAVVEKYAKKDKRIRCIEQKNMGVAKTRNKAVELARGEFIAFIDNDDYIDEDYLEKLLPREGEDVVVSGYRRPDSEKKIKTEVALGDEYWSRFVVVAPWAKIYQKDFIIKNKLEFLDNNIGEDVYFNLIAMLVAEKVKILKYVGYNWFYNEKSVSNTKQRKFRDINVFGFLDSCYDELKRRKLIEDNYEILELYFYRYIVWFLLYAAKGAKKAEINKVYDELFDWLEKRFPDYRKNKLLKGELPGEVKATRIAYKTFLKFQRVGLGKVLVWAYAKI